MRPQVPRSGSGWRDHVGNPEVEGQAVPTVTAPAAADALHLCVKFHEALERGIELRRRPRAGLTRERLRPEGRQSHRANECARGLAALDPVEHLDELPDPAMQDREQDGRRRLVDEPLEQLEAAVPLAKCKGVDEGPHGAGDRLGNEAVDVMDRDRLAGVAAQRELLDLDDREATLVAGINVALSHEPADPCRQLARRAGCQRDLPLPRARFDPVGQRTLTRRLDPADEATGGADRLGHDLARWVLLARLGLLDDREPVARSDLAEDLEETIAIGSSPGQRAGAGEEREGAVAEQ